MKFYMGQFPRAFEKDNSSYSYREEDGSIVCYTAGQDGITEEWLAVLKEEHRSEVLSDKRHRRNRFDGESYSDRVISIDTYGMDSFERFFGIRDPEPYGENIIIEAENRLELHKRFMCIWQALTAQQQRLLSDIERGVSQKEIADREGVSAVAIWKRLQKIRKKAGKFF